MNYFNMNINLGDQGYWWRTQGSRSMTQLDQLCQLKLNYQNKIGAEKAREIESDISKFSDAD